MSQTTEEFIETVDARHLQEHDWLIVRLLAGSFLDRLALARYRRRLLASGRWERLRAERRRDAQEGAAPTVFDLYGTPAQPGSNASPSPTGRRAAGETKPTSEGAAPATALARWGSRPRIRLSSPIRHRKATDADCQVTISNPGLRRGLPSTLIRGVDRSQERRYGMSPGVHSRSVAAQAPRAWATDRRDHQAPCG